MEPHLCPFFQPMMIHSDQQGVRSNHDLHSVALPVVWHPFLDDCSSFSQISFQKLSNSRTSNTIPCSIHPSINPFLASCCSPACYVMLCYVMLCFVVVGLSPPHPSRHYLHRATTSIPSHSIPIQFDPIEWLSSFSFPC